mgnify:CR=1 FL=1
MSDASPTTENLANHVIILGWDEFASLVTEQLVASQHQVVVVTREEEDRERIHEAFDPSQVMVFESYLADFQELEHVAIESCLKVFVNLGDDRESLVAILKMKDLYDGIEYDVLLEDKELKDTFYVAGVRYAVSKFNISAKVLASHLYEPDAAEYMIDLLAATETDKDLDVQQYQILESNPLAGEPYGDAFWKLKTEHDCVPVGLSKAQPDGHHELHKIPEDDLLVEAGDFMLLVIRGAAEAGIEELFGVIEGMRQ